MRAEILKAVLLRSKSEVCWEKDKNVFNVVDLAGCPEGCVFIWHDERGEC